MVPFSVLQRGFSPLNFYNKENGRERSETKTVQTETNKSHSPTTCYNE